MLREKTAMKSPLTALTILGSVVCSMSAAESHSHHDHAHESAEGGEGFLAPFEHLHFSPLGTPIVHSFGVEPAITGRDLFADYRYRNGDGFTEHEIELELEWAFTRRLGIIVEAPYIFEREDGGETVDGFGDLVFVPRAILLERDRYILTAQIEVVTPTGTNGFGDETAIAPGFAAWFDLGNWWTLNTQLAVEHVFDEDVTDLVYGFGLVKTIDLACPSSSKDPHEHRSASGLFNLHFEVTGTVGLGGEDDGVVNAEGLLGLSYGLSSAVDVRVGYEFPLSSPNDFNGGLVSGFVLHF